MSELISELQCSRGCIQFTQFTGGDQINWRMIQLTQGIGTALGGNDSPGFIQLTVRETYVVIQELAKWLQLVTQEEANRLTLQINEQKELRETVFEEAVVCQRFIEELKLLDIPLRLLGM